MLGSLLMTVLAVYFPVKKLLFPSGCGRPPATADCYDHANAATDCNALPCAESRFSELVFLEAGEPIGAREETGKRREGTVASEPTLSPTSLVLSLPGRGWRGQPSARNHCLQHAVTNEREADFLTLVVQRWGAAQSCPELFS